MTTRGQQRWREAQRQPVPHVPQARGPRLPGGRERAALPSPKFRACSRLAPRFAWLRRKRTAASFRVGGIRASVDLGARSFQPADLTALSLVIAATSLRRSECDRSFARRGAATSFATLWTIPSIAIFIIPRWCAEARCSWRFRPPAKVRRWPSACVANWKNNLARSTPSGSSNLARARAGLFAQRAWIRKRAASFFMNWPAASRLPRPPRGRRS